MEIFDSVFHQIAAVLFLAALIGFLARRLRQPLIVAFIISTTPDLHANLALTSAAREHGFSGQVAVAAHGPADGARLEEAGADLVLLPFDHAADRVLADLDLARPEGEPTG